MLPYKLCITLVSFLLAISSITVKSHHRSQTTSSSSSSSSLSILVDPSGQGDFRTIQSAIDSVPSHNTRWTTININAGVYMEKVLIPRNKPYIYLKGAGTNNTFIVWEAHDSIESATFSSEANNTLAKDITFSNPHNFNHRNIPIEKAVAARIKGDKSAFYRCNFLGVQDTLWDVQGRHYYKSCIIKGAVDFIFGAAQTIFESCTIEVDGSSLNGNETRYMTVGYITAQGRENARDTNGFVFKSCNIVGSGKAYLGRAWKEYARVLFYNTQMMDIVEPRGWDAWYGAGKEGQLTLSEYNCSGEGATSSNRVGWEKKLNEEEVKKLTNISFIDNEGWLEIALDILGG